MNRTARGSSREVVSEGTQGAERATDHAPEPPLAILRMVWDAMPWGDLSGRDSGGGVGPHRPGMPASGRARLVDELLKSLNPSQGEIDELWAAEALNSGPS